MTVKRNTRRRRKTRVKGWAKETPTVRQRNAMMKKCGKKCFLGSFPICVKNTCRISRKGLEAAYMRARQYETITGVKKYTNIANRAKRMLDSVRF